MLGNQKIGIIGCGNMGEAILSRLAGVVEKSTSLMVSEADAVRRDHIQSKYKIIVEIDNNVVVKYSDVIILAVKPKDFDSVLKQEVCCGLSQEKMLISIAAGITTGYIESIIGKDICVIRAMPNMGAVIGEAVTALCRGSSADQKDMAAAEEIFSLIGDVVEVDEKDMDAVTALSGSGPAYFFYLIEALTEAAEKAGLKKDIARALVLKTALGSSKLLEALEEDPAVLRKKVASKGGTTEAALNIFEKKKFKGIINDAVKAACKRSKELSKR
ncbi:MAG: pyrroline-5-carboxylate reductase [Candidatus Omnitrophica bacterium]|nr:pyrroline-5-carboxylate reductase [Candidatus Omnitrophota bacterium]MDD5436398.1 pyrroline-5-carboxylate reductase [Candidatus Omnitrophota bacterium]